MKDWVYENTAEFISLCGSDVEAVLWAFVIGLFIGWIVLGD